MLTAVLVVIPIFAIIASGFFAGRLELLGPSAASELNKFVVFLALPALIFDVVAGADWATVWQPGFILAYMAGTFAVFVFVLLLRLRSRRPLADSSVDALNAGYANAGYMGFPVCESVFGRSSFPLVTLAALLTVSVLFAVAIACVEIGLQEEARVHQIAWKVVRSLLKNPLIIAPLAGGAWAALRLPIPPPLHTYLTFLGATASSCALVALGAFLSRRHAQPSGAPGLVGLLVACKLLLQPAVTALVALPVLHLEMRAASIAILIAALPTGTGPYMIAEYYQRDALVTSKTILYSTVGSVLTLAVLVHWLRLN